MSPAFSFGQLHLVYLAIRGRRLCAGDRKSRQAWPGASACASALLRSSVTHLVALLRPWATSSIDPHARVLAGLASNSNKNTRPIINAWRTRVTTPTTTAAVAKPLPGAFRWRATAPRMIPHGQRNAPTPGMNPSRLKIKAVTARAGDPSPCSPFAGGTARAAAGSLARIRLRRVEFSQDGFCVRQRRLLPGAGREHLKYLILKIADDGLAFRRRNTAGSERLFDGLQMLIDSLPCGAVEIVFLFSHHSNLQAVGPPLPIPLASASAFPAGGLGREPSVGSIAAAVRSVTKPPAP